VFEVEDPSKRRKEASDSEKSRKKMNASQENINEIVYEDPGSVKDIRKRFGTRTSTEFIKPKNPSVCAKAGEILFPETQKPAFPNDLPKTIQEQNNYTKAWQEIINEGFREAEKTIESSLDEKENIIKPVKPPKPARTVSKARGRVYANTNVKSNPELLAKINEVTRKNAVIKDFETAVSEFYASLRQFESMK